MDFRSKTDVRASDNIREELMEFIQSQYAASPILCGILSSLRDNIDTKADLDLFYKKIFDISTAAGMGIDTWGEILGIRRSVKDPATGFMMQLTDDGYRTLLMYKALANIMDATPASLNYLINLLYPESASYVLVVQEESIDNGLKYNARPMHVRWVIEHYLSDEEKAVFSAAGTLCRGAGVGWDMYQADADHVFGFAGSGFQPFNQGVFDPYGITEGD